MSGINKYYFIEKKRRGTSTANESHISEVLETFLKRSHIDYNPYEDKIKELFRQITGTVIAKFTTDIHMEHNILFVKTSLPAVRAELMMVRDALKDNINKKLGKEILKSIIIK